MTLDTKEESPYNTHHKARIELRVSEMKKELEHLLGLIKDEQELVVPGEDRDKLKKGSWAWRTREKKRKETIDKSVEKVHARAKTQAKYYRKNKEVLNAKRRLRNSDPTYVFNKMENRARRREIEWTLTFEEFTDIWLSAPDVIHPATKYTVTAWQARSSNWLKGTQMARKDTHEGWNKENVHITFCGDVHYDPYPGLRTDDGEGGVEG